MNIEVLQHRSGSYGPRTFENAKGADLTVAFATDFSTAGEKLTAKAAGDRYLAIPLATGPLEAARMLFRACRAQHVKTLNVAGNGIYTLAKHGWTQQRTDEHVYRVLAKVHEHWALSHVRSGGQTGIDLAGVTAGYALGIPVTALLPCGFKQRYEDKADRCHSEEEIRAQIVSGAARLPSQ